jgi:penicillin-binding protein 2
VDTFSKRKYLILAIIFGVGIIYLLKIFVLQVISTKYKESATNNVLREMVQFPARGLIYDRNGKLMVYNKPAYDLMVTPREVEPFDTISFCTLVEINKEELIEGLKKARDYSSYKPSILVNRFHLRVLLTSRKNYINSKDSRCSREHCVNTQILWQPMFLGM